MGYVIIINAVIGIATIWCGVWFRYRMAQDQASHAHAITGLQRALETATHVIRGMGERVITVESNYRKLLSRQHELEQAQRKQGLEQAYHHAKKLCELGMDIEAVATHCHIPIAEVMLIAKLAEQNRASVNPADP